MVEQVTVDGVAWRYDAARRLWLADGGWVLGRGFGTLWQMTNSEDNLVYLIVKSDLRTAMRIAAILINEEWKGARR